MFVHGVAGCESSRICVLRMCLKFIIALPEISDAHYVFLTRHCKRPLTFRARVH